jgi:hypothetical protein
MLIYEEKSFGRCTWRWSDEPIPIIWILAATARCALPQAQNVDGGACGELAQDLGISLLQDPLLASCGRVEVTGESGSDWGSWGTSGATPSLRMRCVRVIATGGCFTLWPFAEEGGDPQDPQPNCKLLYQQGFHLWGSCGNGDPHESPRSPLLRLVVSEAVISDSFVLRDSFDFHEPQASEQPIAATHKGVP